jgi:DNA-binding XRE family transcriptional regulator
MIKTDEIKIGDRFGRFIVVGFEGSKCVCICDCRKRVVHDRFSLVSGRAKSCGCLKLDLLVKRSTTHGASSQKGRAPEYNAWWNMIARCGNPNNVMYHRYGARGISVCQRWLDDYENFFHDVGKRPSSRYSLERKNKDGNYEPGNVKWATRREQSRNTCRNVMLEINGVTKCLSDWSISSPVSFAAIEVRLKNGWCSEDAVFLPKHSKGRRTAEEFNMMVPSQEFARMRIEMKMSQAALAKSIGVQRETISRWESGRVKLSNPAFRLVRRMHEEWKKR